MTDKKKEKTRAEKKTSNDKITSQKEDGSKIRLPVEKRNTFGKKLKRVRREGLLPANIYGEGFKSQSVMLPMIDFSRIYKKAGETQVVYLFYQKKELPVLISNLQKHPVSDMMLHVDFRKVDLKKKIETEVPIELVGESGAVTQNKGVLQTISDTVSVEALPDKIPSNIEVDISALKELNDEIKVSNLTVSGDYIFKDDSGKTLLRITEHKEEEVAPQVEEPEAEAEEEEAAATDEEVKEEPDKKEEAEAIGDKKTQADSKKEAKEGKKQEDQKQRESKKK